MSRNRRDLVAGEDAVRVVSPWDQTIALCHDTMCGDALMAHHDTGTEAAGVILLRCIAPDARALFFGSGAIGARA
jgi:hypothetical protein